MIIAYVVEEAGRSLITQRIEADTSKGAWRAVAAILTGLCDAVVHVDSGLTMIGDCPQLGHLLMSGLGVSHRSEGGSFVRHVVPEDKQTFLEFIERQCEAVPTRATSGHDSFAESPAAINVSLKDAMGSSFRVEVLHTHLSNLGDDGHLLAIRDLGDCKKEALIDCTLPQTHIRADQPEPFASNSDSLSLSGSLDSDLSNKGVHANTIHSLSLLVDVLEPNLPIMEAVTVFRDPDQDISDRGDVLAPTLSAWLPRGKFDHVRDWVQSSANAYEHERSIKSYNQITLRLLGSAVKMSAQRAHLEIDDLGADEADEHDSQVRVCFEDLTLHFSSMLRQHLKDSRQRPGSLPCIHEQSTALRSATQIESTDAPCDSAQMRGPSFQRCTGEIGPLRVRL
eukprot:TRINITY_DN72459_c0_g1_i1.p1 TRINITY_DN72459_c0_g1~~TRINITY_DN72459_c0_g1_i1.p1  ORF type:complete len:433 (+),score=31.23 TRINITY_DN72459_c0_g1_i1:117-1301(+)